MVEDGTEAPLAERRCSLAEFVTDHLDTNMFYKTMRELTQGRNLSNVKNVIKDLHEIII